MKTYYVRVQFSPSGHFPCSCNLPV